MADPHVGRAVFEQAESMDALLLGHRTYEIFASYWPSAPPDMPFTRLLNGITKYVASRTLPEPLTWHGAQKLAGDLAVNLADVEARHAEVRVIGSLNLVQALLRLGLVDRLDLWLFPLVLGSGKRVFGGGTVPADLLLTESVAHANGVLQPTYEAGARPDSS